MLRSIGRTRLLYGQEEILDPMRGEHGVAEGCEARVPLEMSRNVRREGVCVGCLLLVLTEPEKDAVYVRVYVRGRESREYGI